MEYDPEIFFDLGSGGRFNNRKVMRAKRVCAECPVRRRCLRYNIAVPYGVFGGATPLERVRILITLGKLEPNAIKVYGSASETLRYYQGQV